MSYPAFFNDVRKITLRDPLAEFLGAAEGGAIEYSYLDAVKLAGHSCPTVAGIYLMTLKALKHLYGGEIPERGAIRGAFRDDIASRVTGGRANVASLLTGAPPGGDPPLGGGAPGARRDPRPLPRRHRLRRHRGDGECGEPAHRRRPERRLQGSCQPLRPAQPPFLQRRHPRRGALRA